MQIAFGASRDGGSWVVKKIFLLAVVMTHVRQKGCELVRALLVSFSRHEQIFFPNM